ncbi:MAG: FG-GAP-like repeat-containing protein [Elusimicrobia bacterium]|nr:FG-GAP-like repeat-containing protein [Elusimicrobiota bacterium]
MGKIIRWCMMVAVVMTGFAAVLQAAPGSGIAPGDIFKEVYVWTTPPSRNCANMFYRVTDPGATYAPIAGSCNDPIDFLPNYVQTFTSVDLTNATGAEVVVEMWGGHIGTSGKKFKVNNNAWINIPENTDVSSPECYLNVRYPAVAIPLSQLLPGSNTIEFTAGPQTCNSMGWGQWAYYGLKLRVYYDANKTHPTGSITSPTASSTINDNPTISANVNTYSGGINRVDFIGYYDDFDENGDGIYTQWHYRYLVRNGAMAGHIGTDTSAPYSVTWDTTWVPDQAASSMKFMAVIVGSDNMCYATPEIAGVSLSRTTISVKMYKPSNVPTGFSVVAGTSPNYKICNIAIPSSPLTVTGARISVVNWNGAEGGITQSVTLAGTQICTTFPNGTDHDYGFSNITVPTSLITVGTKEFRLTAQGIVNWTHGPEVTWPGPVLFVQYNTGGMQTVADPSINPNGGTYSSAQTVQITCATAGAIIRYTTDGSDPTNGTVYSSPLTISQDTTLKAIATKTGMLNSNVVTSAAFTITAPPQGDPLYYVPVNVAVGNYTRSDKPVEVAVNFTQYLTALSVSGSLNDQSLRVRETDSTGNTVINDSVVFQFDKDATYNAASNAIGTVTFMMSGTTNASATRYFRIFFDIDPSITKVNFTKQVTLTDNVMDENQASYKFDTANATYYYHKVGAGFSSMVDSQNNDWISYSLATGGAGEYRGIPNMAYEQNPTDTVKCYFHPGFDGSANNKGASTSNIISQGPLKVRISSVSSDNKWKCYWDVFPKYARMTLYERDPNRGYWFLYEGTPGGSLDTASDYIVKSDNTRMNISATSPNNDELPDPEWVYFADGSINRSLYLVNHKNPDGLTDSYYTYPPMTVFGFGRGSGLVGQLNYTPAYFTIGFADSRDYATTKDTIESAWRDLTTTLGTPGSSGGPTKVATPQFSLPAGTYSGPQLNVISCGTGGATIKYTTDGSDPLTSLTATSGNSPQVATISASGTLRVAAVKSGLENSYENSAAYIISAASTPTGFTKYSSKDGYIPLPGTGEYTASLVLDIDNDGIDEPVVMERKAGPAIVWYKKNGNNWDKHVIESGIYPIEAGGTFADIDNDGDLDIFFTGDWTSNQAWWWENPGPQNVLTATSWKCHLVKSGDYNYQHDSAFGDFDGDGKLELAWFGRQEGSSGTSKLYLAKVPADAKTRTTAWPYDTIATKTNITDGKYWEGMVAADIDLDGKVDIVGGGGWWKYVSGIQYTRSDIDTAESAVRGRVAVGQLKKGGRPEVVFGAGDFTGFLAWYEWNGGTSGTPSDWTKHTLDTNVKYGHSVRVGDLDTDGDIDIFFAEIFTSGLNDATATGRMLIYKNDGAANPGFTETLSLGTGLNNHESRLGDFNGDGRLDIFQKSYADQGKPAGESEIAVWLQTGGGKKGLTNWTYKEVDTTRAGYGSWYRWFGIAAADMNNDGYKDIVSGKYFYKNPAGDMTGNWTRTIFPVNVDASLVTDVDSDANADVIAFGLNSSFTPNPGVYWLEKTGAGDTTGDWTAIRVVPNTKIPPTLHSQSQGMKMAQIIPGGREEIVIAAGDPANPGTVKGRVYYIQIPLVNPQTPDSWQVTEISNSNNTQGISVGDIDGDGDIDVAGVKSDNQTVVWWENPYPATNGNWIEHTIGNASPLSTISGSDGADRVELADLNGDGRLDLVMTDEVWDGSNPNRETSRTYWFTCPADPKTATNWGNSNEIVKQASTNSLGVADLDFDGDIDVVTGEVYGNKEISIWENNGTGSFTKNLLLTKETHNSAYLSDLDGDGDLDMVNITWVANFTSDGSTGGLMYILRNDNPFGGGGDNNPAPVVVISNPTPNQEFEYNSNIIINATAYDDVSVSKVDFYNGNTLLGTDNTSPYSYTWNSVKTGNYTIRVVATDNLNKTGSTQVSIKVKSSGSLIPVGKWDMEGTSGSSTATDTSGNNNNGTLTNMDTSTCWVAGKVGTGLKFDGTNDYVSVPNSTSLDINGDQLTLITWVRIDSIAASNGYQVFIAKPAADGTHNDPYYSYSLHGDWISSNPTVLTPRFALNIGGSLKLLSASQNLTAGSNWYHVAAVYNGATMKIYVDGVERGSTAQTGNITASGAALRLGVNGANQEPLNGAMDGVKIYDVALTVDEILADMNLTSQPPTISISTIAITNGTNAPATVRIDATASDSDGTVSKVEFYNGITLLGEDTSSPYSYTWNSVGAGTYSITAKATDNSNATTTTASQIIVITAGSVSQQQAYPGGVAWSIGTGTTTIQMEDYDMVTSGTGEGEAYSDTTVGNSGNEYRTDDVDVRACSDTGAGYQVGWAKPGEWLEYSINVNQGGEYKVILRTANGLMDTAGPIHLEFGTHNLSPYSTTPSIGVPPTGGFDTWADVEISSSVTLTAGNQIMKLVMENSTAEWCGDFNYIKLVRISAETPNTVATPTISPSAGTYSDFVTVTLGCATNGATIRYTTDGITDPTSSSILYSAPFTLTASATVRARAFKAAMTDSSVNSVAYTITGTSPQHAYHVDGSALPWQIGIGTSTIEVENYDTVTTGLAEGETYNDTTPGNSGGAYRTTEAVDIEICGDTGGGYDVGWTLPTEWLEYSVSVSETAEYKIILRAANGLASAGNPIHIEFGTHNLTPYILTPSVSVPVTGGFQVWTDIEVSSNVSLTSGSQIMKLVMDSGSADWNGNFNYIKIIRLSADITPPVVSVVTPSNISGSGIVIRWTTNEPSTSKVEYGLTTSYGNSTPVTDSGGVYNHSVTLSGLTENTLYHYRIVSTDMNGNPTTTGDYSFTTTANDTKAPVISNVVAGVSQNTAVITWNTDEASDSQVAYGLTTSLGSTTTLDTAKYMLHSVTITGLQKGKIYYYKVYSKDATGNLATSSQYSFKTYNLKHKIYTYYYDDGTTATKTGASAAASLKFKVQVYNVDENSIATDYTGTVTLTTKNSKSSVLDTTDSTLTGADSGEKEVSIPFRSDINTVELTGDTTAPIVISFNDMYISKLVGYQGGTIRGANGLKILIPTGVLSTNKYLASIKTSAVPAVKNSIKYVNTVNPICYNFGELTFGESAPKLEDQVFTRAVNITIPWTASDIGTLNEDGLRIYYWTGTDWELVTGIQTVDKTNNTVTATVKHFSTYRILGSYLSADMNNVRVYPNPYNPTTAVLGKLKVMNLPVNSVMKLYNVSGGLVRELKEIDFGNLGWIEWDGKNADGDKVGRGVYVYQIEDSAGNKKTGKIGLVK